MGITSTGLIKVSFPFDEVTNAQLRKIRPRGTFRGIAKGWEFPLLAAKALQDELGTRFLIKNDFAQWLEWIQKPLPPLPPHKDLLKKADLHVEIADGRMPLPHQRSGASWLLARRGAVLADEMGLGKTLTSLLAARAMARCCDVRVIVLAPMGLHSHWQREAKTIHLPITLHSWASIPSQLVTTGFLLIVDEAHFAQSIQAKRTKSLLRLARHPRLRAIWMLTGTPMKNGRPIQLYPLLAAIDHPLAKNQNEFEERFCNPILNRRGKSTYSNNKDSSNLVELRRLTSSIILHRKKNLLGLPPKTRHEYNLELLPLEATGFNHRLKIVIDDYRSRAARGFVNADTEALVYLTALRRIASEFKLPAVAKLLTKLLDKGESIVVFSSYVQPLSLMHESLGGDLLTGQQTIKQREISVERFQKGINKLLLATYNSGGYGLTLHRARHVVLLERPWTPGDVEQAEDRCHRLGMKGRLVSHWFKLGFADELVDSLLLDKAKRIEVLLGRRKVQFENQSLSIMMKRCLQLF